VDIEYSAHHNVGFPTSKMLGEDKGYATNTQRRRARRKRGMGSIQCEGLEKEKTKEHALNEQRDATKIVAYGIKNGALTSQVDIARIATLASAHHVTRRYPSLLFQSQSAPQLFQLPGFRYEPPLSWASCTIANTVVCCFRIRTARPVGNNIRCNCGRTWRPRE
jgi:hypothetical protein